MGYHQLALDEKSVPFTSFVTPFGQFEYLRVPFGLTNAPKVFQRVITQIVGNVPFAKVFLDDILIFSSSKEEHLTDILKKLHEYNVTISTEKSHFFQEQVTYLGHIIDSEGLKTDISRIAPLDNWKVPKSVKQLQKLLGFINWFRPFIKNLSIEIQPLTDLLRKASPLSWKDNHTTIVNNIIGKIKDQTLLSYPDYIKPFHIETDASELGMGAVLYQQRKVISFYSSKFSGSTVRYTIPEKELLAVINALEYFRPFILLGEIHIYTDPLNLTHPLNSLSCRAQRWKLLMDEYQPIIHYKSGDSNVIADQLSRIFLCHSPSHHSLFDPDDYEQDPDGRFTPNEDQIHSILETTHQKLNHPGISTTIRTLQPYWKIPKLKDRLKRLQRRCVQCQKHYQTRYGYGLIHGHIGTSIPFQDISTDIYGSIDSFLFEGAGDKSKLHLLTISDRATRWSEVLPLEDLSCKSVCKHLKSWIQRHGVPKTYLSDQGRQYIGTEFQDFLKEHNIQSILATAYNPTGNSISERINQTLTRVLKTKISKSLDEALHRINWTLQNQSNRNLGASPHELVQGYSAFDPSHRDTSHLLNLCFKRSLEAANSDELRSNAGRIPYSYHLGQSVMKQSQKQGKLAESWDGPYEIINIDDQQNRFTLKGQGKQLDANVKQIRPL